MTSTYLRINEHTTTATRQHSLRTAATRAANTLTAYTATLPTPDPDRLEIRIIGTPERVAELVTTLAVVTGEAYAVSAHAARTPGHVRAYLHPTRKE